MVLKIGIHRYTGKGANVPFLKKKNKNKSKLTNERSFDLLKIFSLIITSLSLHNIFRRVAANACDHRLWNLRVTKSYKNDEILFSTRFSTTFSTIFYTIFKNIKN